MSSTQSAPPVPELPRPPGGDERRAGLEAASEALVRTLRLAGALVRSRRAVDLAGLEDWVGRLCARALDLPYADGQALRPGFVAVLVELDALTCALAETAGTD